jgi:hypothetical protein
MYSLVKISTGRQDHHGHAQGAYDQHRVRTWRSKSWKETPPGRLRRGSPGATAAATTELLEGGVAEVRHRMTFDYRWAEQNSATPIGEDEDWSEDGA